MPQQNVIELLDQLIAFDTTSHRSNLPLIDFIETWLARHGVSSHRVMDTSGEKANLYATIGPDDRRGVMLSGHTDTVPVTGQAWQTPPFELTRDGARLHGRGTADMKGFLACVLAAVPEMVAAELVVPVHLAFSHDEEVGCLGVRTLIADMANYPCPPAACIIGEPTSMRLATTHKGKLAVRLNIEGKACHSGMAPEGVNAIHVAAQVIGHIARTAHEKSLNGPFDNRYTIPHTTLQVGMIRGGAALNIVPQHCQLDIEIRTVPAEDPETLLDGILSLAASLEGEMQALYPGSAIRMERLGAYPGLSMKDDDDLVGILLTLLDDQKLERIGYGTEAGLFQQALGIPSLVCGPGNMAQGHQPDEYITQEQLNKCSAFLRRLITQLQDPIVAKQLTAER
ncbi:MAG: acetylornithine deacetylase [Cobetia marina]